MRNHDAAYLPQSGGPAPKAPDLPPWGETRVIGKPLPRVDGYERVSGSAVYTRDLDLPGMLHAAIVRCPHAHARVKRVDTQAAEKMPGVYAAVTGSTPGAKIPWYFDEKGPKSWLFDPVCRYQGEEVAAVAAETPEQAQDAARAVVVEYETLPFVIDTEKALAEGAVAVHPGGNRQGDPEVYERGDLKAGFAAADVVLEESYRTSTQLHTTMEVHCAVVRWDGDRLTVWESLQGVFDSQSVYAQCFGLPVAWVRVISHYMGSGFGSKLEPNKHTVIAALLARIAARPVKIALPREDTFLCVGNRPPNSIRLKAGVKKDGTLTALSVQMTGTSGAYPGGTTSPYLVMDLYLCPNVRAEEVSVYTHAGKERAMRAPGFPQCAWALEQMMDSLAEKLRMDPVDLRLKNIPTVSQARKDRPFTSTGLKQCLQEGAKAFGWVAARKRAPVTGPWRRGVGMAAAMWGYPGHPSATAIVKLYADGSVNLNMGCSDIGCGTKTVMAMVVSEELTIPLDRIQIEHADTATTQYAPASGGSQTVLVNAPAVRSAAAAVRADLLALAAEELKKSVDSLALRDGAIEVKDEAGRRVAFSELKALASRQVIMGIGRRGPNPADKVALPFAAQFAEVEVNERTGQIRVVRMVAAHDSGRVMNRLTYENQVFGGIAMGTGFGLSEGRVLDRQTGRMVNANWHDYKIPTALDVAPEPICVPIDPHDTECNTTGAKGLGEPATIPTAAALANAVYNAIGVRFTDAPITPMRVVQSLAARRERR